jgi:hypothetical protein
MGVLVTYDDGNRLEDVMRMVIQLSPTDTPFVSGIAKTRASNTYHMWPEDTLASRGDNAIAEGASFSSSTITAPTRVANVTQIFEKTFLVSSTERWVKGAGIDDMYLYQQQKALMEIANDVEHAFIRGSRATGNASTARRMAGALNFITTNATAVASGTKLTESFYNGLAELCYEAGGRPDEVYVGAKLKRVISSYTAGATKNVASDDKRLTLAVDVYESDFGVQKIFLARDMVSGTNANAIMMIQNRKFKMAVGEPISLLPQSEVAQSTHGTLGVVRGELTLEALGERHNAKATGLSGDFA